MTLRPFLTANAVAGLAFGVVLVSAPSILLQLYGIPGGQGAELMARLFGAELLGLNVPSWFARNDIEGRGAAFAVFGHAIAETLGFAVSLGVALAGIGNAMVWSVVAIFAFFSAGNLYFIFVKGVKVV